MQALSYHCGKCGAQLQVRPVSNVHSNACPSCQVESLIYAFPALLKEAPKGELGTNIVVEAESSCFEHPDKQAVVACDGCGKFLCALCDITWGNKHLCSTCVAAGVGDGNVDPKNNTPAQRFYHYDSIALITLAIAIFPLYLLSFIIAPVSIFLCIYGWKKEPPTPRRKIRFVLAFIGSILILGFWGVIFMEIFLDGMNS